MNGVVLLLESVVTARMTGQQFTWTGPHGAVHGSEAHFDTAHLRLPSVQRGVKFYYSLSLFSVSFIKYYFKWCCSESECLSYWDHNRAALVSKYILLAHTDPCALLTVSELCLTFA